MPGARTKLEIIWSSMKGRCYTRSNGAYSRYGAKGVTVCSDWLDFQVFKKWAYANGYSAGLSLDRVNNSLGYSPDNCRWVSRKTQLRNRTNNRKLTAFGETKLLCEWMEDPRCKTTYSSLWKRLQNNWNPELAIQTPSKGI